MHGKLILIIGMVCGFLSSEIGRAQEPVADPLAGVKCVVNGDGAAKIDQVVDFAEGQIYFCCDGCVEKFAADPQAYLVRAHHQLVLTGQYVQKSCPISGNALSPGTELQVGGCKIAFCCPGCKAKVATAVDLSAKAELVFSQASFARAFEKRIELQGVTCPVGGGPAAEEFSAEYLEGVIYFCCEGCAAKFAAAEADYQLLANYQLVATGQYVQTACPFSGADVGHDMQTKVGKISVGFCNQQCQNKVAKTPELSDQIALVFAPAAFKKGFAKKKSTQRTNPGN